MKKTTLAIMAAGLGSRFTGGIKQLAPVGPNGEIIMDYSVHDALEAGFDKIVFIIRKDLEKAFKESIGNRMEKYAEVSYVFQELDALPEGFEKPEGRTKPWGTGQAIMCCKGTIQEPFAVINADDYYGKDAFKKVHEYLVQEHTPNDICMIGFVLKNTLSEHGGVTRGICEKDENGNLIAIHETYQIMKSENGVGSLQEDGTMKPVDMESLVSMNMWGLQPEFLAVLENGCISFLERGITEDLRKEYLLPRKIDELLQAGEVNVSVVGTDSHWFGVTFQEDKESVIKEIAALVEQGVYKADLWSDRSK